MVLFFLCEDIVMKQGDKEPTNMEKTNKTFKANKIAYVERWVMHFGKNKEYDGVEANQLPNGKWACEIDLPLIEQTVKTVASTEINAMLNGANKAAKAIQEFLSEHPEVKWIPLSKFRHWEIEMGEHGFVSLHLNSEYRKKSGEQMLMMQQESIKAVKKAIARIKRVNGSDKDLFIQVLDRSLFKEDATNDEIYKKIFDTMYDEHNIFITSINCDSDSDHVIVVGYSSLREEFEEYLK